MRRADAQTSEVTTEYLMTLYAPLEPAALNRGEMVTDKTVPCFVIAPTFQTSSADYDWLNKVQAVGKMVELKRGDGYYIKYDIFIVR
jgi:hypothetical protein